IMADLNIPANDAPVEQAPVVAPPTRTDDQILPLSKWVPIGKSNCVLDVHKPQRNPIFLIVVALLKNTNFFRAFTASSMIPAIYIQQFWDTICFNSSTGLYSCQLDEQWFNLQKDILRDALNITPANDNNPFVAPPSSDTVIEYVNTLGYPSTLRNMSTISVNAFYQPWRAILSMINMCLTGKTTRYDTPRHPVLQILWGIIHRSNINYDERIWEEFVQSIQTFLTNRKNLATAARGKKKTAHLLIPKRGKAEEGGATESSYATKVTKPKAAKETPDEPSPAKRSKGGLVEKRRKPKSPLKLVDKPSDEGVPVEDPAHTDEEADLQRALELKVQGKGKEKVIDEQAAHDLLTLQTPTKKSHVDKFIFQRCPPMPTEPTGHADLPSLDTELALTDSETESDEEVHVINPGEQDEGQAGPNPGIQDKGQAGSNPGDAVESQAQPSHVQMDEEFTTTAYPNVHENLKLPTEDQFFMEKPHEEESGKTNAETEVKSMVSVPIHQDTSSVPPMTTPVIDLTMIHFPVPPMPTPSVAIERAI
ncbi:hypothetical protein Tco_0114939, partial [Tanacetum coccineum]